MSLKTKMAALSRVPEEVERELPRPVCLGFEALESAYVHDRGDQEKLHALACAYAKAGLLYSAYKLLVSCAGKEESRTCRALRKRLEKDGRVKAKEVTFYIPCFNVEKWIAPCLEGILSQTYPVKEVLVVDDCSRDATRKIAEKYPVKVISHPQNIGLSAGRNTALRAAKGEFIACVDADVVPDKFWLEFLMMNVEEENVAAAGGRLIEARTLTAVDRWRQVNMRQDSGPRRKKDPRVIFGCGNVFRRKALQEAGGYNEQFRLNHEDTDMTQRVKMLGYSVIYEPLAVARHLRTDTLATLANTYWRWYRTSQGELAGAYNTFETLWRKTSFGMFRLASFRARNLRARRLHLLYIDIAVSVWEILEDILYLSAYAKVPRRVAEDTLVSFLAGLKAVLSCNAQVPQGLCRMLFEDVSPLFERTTDETKALLKKFGIAPFRHDRDTAAACRRAKDLLPQAEPSFVHSCLKEWNQRFKGNPVLWKMAEVCAKRIRYEAEHPPYDRPGYKVMLCNLPWGDAHRFGVRAGSRWPFTMERQGQQVPGYVPFPFFMAYATAVLEEAGSPVVMVDAIAEGLTDEAFLERVRGYTPDLIVMETSTPSIGSDMRWAALLKERLPGARVAVTGPHASALTQEMMRENPAVDFTLTGEYEQTLRELAGCLALGKPLSGVPGLCYRDASGLRMNPRNEGIKDINALPWPHRITLPMYNYHDAGAGLEYPFVQMLASRGCPFGCIFCMWPQVLYGNRAYRTRDPRDVAEEMSSLVEEYGFKGVYFDDDTFNIGKERMHALCQLIMRKGIPVPWSAMARADCADLGMLKEMKAAGLCSIKFGVESGVQSLVDAAGKSLDLGKVKEAVKACKQLGIKVHLTFTFGLPGETKETIAQTVDFCLALDPDSAQFSLTTPFPGTAYYDHLKGKGLLRSEDWRKFDGDRFSIVAGESISAKALEEAVTSSRMLWERHMAQRPKKHGALIPAAGMAVRGASRPRIAIVDLLFRWPPGGGAAYDINEVASGLCRLGYNVELFVPLYHKLFVRGVVAHSLAYPVHQLSFKKNEFIPGVIVERMKAAVDCFDPDYVFIGDGWSFKPYLIDAFSDYRTYVRFYAYENVCLLDNGTRMRGRAGCGRDFLRHREDCLDCINEQILKSGTGSVGVKEMLLSRGLTSEYHRMLSASLRKVRGAIVYNRIMQDILRPCVKNIHVIPSGVDLEAIPYAPRKAVKGEKKRIFMPGRIHEWVKGLGVLQDACEILYRRRKDFQVVVTADHGKKAPYMKYAGWMPREKVLALYKQADVCVVPSRWEEPFGIVALEAMASGKPVVASRVGGLQEIVEDEHTGFLVNPGDPEDLAEKLETLLDLDDLRLRMGAAGRKRVEERYQWDDIIRDHYTKLFPDV